MSEILTTCQSGKKQIKGQGWKLPPLLENAALIHDDMRALPVMALTMGGQKSPYRVPKETEILGTRE